MHSAHPDVHDHGLADGCSACETHAAHPLRDLDEQMIQALAVRAVDRACGARHEERSIAELFAETQILNLLEQVGRLAECAPAELQRYLVERWHLPAVIEPRPLTARERALRESVGLPT